MSDKPLNGLISVIIDDDALFEGEKDLNKLSIAQLGELLKVTRAKLDYADFIKKEMQKAYDHLSINVVPERMEDEGVEIMKIADVGRLQVKDDIYCSVPADNKSAVQAWLKKSGNGSLIAPTVNASTFKAFVKGCIKDNEEWPEELIKVTPYSRATVVKT